MTKENKNKEGFKRASGYIGVDYKFEEPNESLQGELISTKSGVGSYNSNVYSIESEGVLYNVWGCTNLDMQMEEVPLGSEVIITYLGKEKNKKTGRDYKKFEVLYKPLDDQAPQNAQDSDIPF